jgi:hypothetical protein
VLTQSLQNSALFRRRRWETARVDRLLPSAIITALLYVSRFYRVFFGAEVFVKKLLTLI